MRFKTISLFAIGLTAIIQAQTPTPVGLWQFDQSTPTKATIGANLTGFGTISTIPGPTKTDSAVQIPKGSYFSMEHGLGNSVNEYTLQFDVRIADNTIYHTLFQTDPKNTNDAECFINSSGKVGITETVYTPTSLLPNQWYRVVIAVKNGERYDTYINGLKVLTGKPQAIGSRFALQSTLLISADDDGENADIDFAKIAIYSKALTDSEVSALGKIVIEKPIAALTKTPDTFTQKVQWNGLFNWDVNKSPINQTLTLNMVKFDIRANNHELVLQDNNGNYFDYFSADVYTYLGSVKEYPDAYVAGVIRRNDGVFEGKIYFDRGNTLFISGTSATGSRGVDYKDYAFPSSPTVMPGAINDTIFEYSMGFDLPYEYFSAIRNKFTPSTISNAFEDTSTIDYVISRLEVSMIQLSAIYINNAKLIPKIGRTIIRTAPAFDPWEIANRTSPLGTIKAHWLANQSDSKRLASAFVSPSYGGGVAWAGMGMEWGFSVNGTSSNESFDIVFRHEHGHNWGIGDNHSNRPEGPTIMCGNQVGRFNGPAVQIMAKARNSTFTRNMMESAGTFNTINMPPYAALDAIEINLDAQNTLIDPIANDHDANNDILTLVSFNTKSNKGGIISRSSSNPNQLIYSSPADGILNVDSTDFFTYQVKDQSGKIATGIVIVKMLPRGTKYYQAEDAKFAGVDVKNSASGYTGTGYLDMNSGKENIYFIEYTVEQWKSTLVNLNFRYTMGSSEDHKMLLTINNKLIDTLVFPKTSNWQTWTSLVKQYTLNEGFNTIRLTALENETANMDALVTWNADGSGNSDPQESIPTILVTPKSYNDKQIIQIQQNQHSILFQALDNNLPINVSLYTLEGKQVAIKNGEHSIQINTQGFASGVYLYKVKQGVKSQHGVIRF